MPFGRDARQADPAFLKADDFHYDGKLADGTFGRGFPAALSITGAFIEHGQGTLPDLLRTLPWRAR